MNRKQLVRERSVSFAIRVVNAAKELRSRGCDHVLVRQFLRSCTSIGANIAEAHVAFSRNEFAYKLTIALREGNETEYWILLLHKTGSLTEAEFASLTDDVKQINKILYTIIKQVKDKSE